MKKIILLLAANLLITGVFAQKVKFIKNAEDSVAYAIGVSMYRGISQLDVDLDLDLISLGMKGAAKQAAIFTTEEANEYIQNYLSNLEVKRAEENKKAGEKFLIENKSAAGVMVTGSGLQYKVLTLGDGPKPSMVDQVKVHYTGYLLDGTKFDSSVDRGEPAIFGVTQVIKGWTEVLQLMTVGSKYKVFIPSDLAYGDRGAGEDIKPGSVLIFEIELVDIEGE